MTPTAAAAPARPRWPYPEVVRASAHVRGSWRARLDGKDVSLGSWRDDPAGERALQNWKTLVAARQSGQIVTPSDLRASRTVRALLELWLNDVQRRVGIGDLSPRTLEAYRSTARWLVRHIDPTLPVAALSAQHGDQLAQAMETFSPVTREHRVRAVGVWASWMKKRGFADLDLGANFKAPTRRALRKHRRENIADRWFRREEILALLDAADAEMRAMTLLGVNTGSDAAAIAALRTDGIDFTRSMLVQPRPKTEAIRRAPLWPETVEALRLVWPRRAGLVFTYKGRPLIESDGRGTRDLVKIRFRRLRETAGVRPLGFRSLKRSYATVSARHPDDLARRIVAGHVVEGVAERYVEDLPLVRFRALTDHVQSWLYDSK